MASSSFTEVSSSCSKPCATIPVIATFDCDLRFARSCEFAIKWLQACFSRHSLRIATHTFFVAMASFDRRHFFSH